MIKLNEVVGQNDMSVLTNIVLEEKERLEKLIGFYKQEIQKFPKGYISKKKRNDKIYCYNSMRVGKTVKTIYIGKENSVESIEFTEKIRNRKEFEKKLKLAKQNLMEAKRMTNG